MYWQLFWFHLAKKRICRICCKRTCNQHLYYCEWKPREISENLNRFLIIDSNSIDPKLYRTRGDVMKIEHFSRVPKNISSKYGTIFKISGPKLPEKIRCISRICPFLGVHPNSQFLPGSFWLNSCQSFHHLPKYYIINFLSYNKYIPSQQ